MHALDEFVVLALGLFAAIVALLWILTRMERTLFDDRPRRRPRRHDDD